MLVLLLVILLLSGCKGSLTGNQNPQAIVLEEGINLIVEFKYTGPDITGGGTKEALL